MKRMIMAIALLLFVLAVGACGSTTTNTTAPSNTDSGTKLMVAGGSYTNVEAKTLKQMLANKSLDRDLRNFVFVNVHIPYEGEIDKTDAFVPYDQVEQKINQFPSDKNAMVFVYCRSGPMSAIAAEKLVQLGYTNVWNLDGGMIAWEQQGFPLIHK